MIRLYRVLPLLVILALIAVLVYMVMSFRYSSIKAKAALIKVFFCLSAILSLFFLLLSVYAVLEQNTAVTELFASCLGLTLLVFVVTLICRAIFRKNHPHYGEVKVL